MFMAFLRSVDSFGLRFAYFVFSIIYGVASKACSYF